MKDKIAKIWEDAKKAHLTKEEIIEKLSSIENVVKNYHGSPRRYYKLKADPKNVSEQAVEACMILFPDMRVEDPEILAMVVSTFGETVISKIEYWEDGHAWVRTVLV